MRNLCLESLIISVCINALGLQFFVFGSPNGCERQSSVLRGYCVGRCPVSQVCLLSTLIALQAIRCFCLH